MRKGFRLRKRDVIVIVAAVIAVLVGIYLVAQWLEDSEAKPETRGDYHLRFEDEQITVNGQKYRQKKNLTTILFMGIDKDSDSAETGSYRNGGQADFLRLVVLDPAEKTISQLQLDRDTMTPVTVLGITGRRMGTRTAQLAVSHGFGDGKEQSCEFTVEAVSNLLSNMSITQYVAMNLDGISVLNDLLGGITVTLEDDFSHIDPIMTKGATVTLVGDQAEIFVRSRKSMDVGTNAARMVRQQTYMSQVMDVLNVQIHEDQEFVGTLFDELSPYLVTNLKRARMINEAWNAKDYERKPLLQIEGIHKVSEDGFMEFYADESSLEQIILELFYQITK